MVLTGLLTHQGIECRLKFRRCLRFRGLGDFFFPVSEDLPRHQGEILVSLHGLRLLLPEVQAEFGRQVSLRIRPIDPVEFRRYNLKRDQERILEA